MKIYHNRNLCFLGSSEDLDISIDHETISNTAETVKRITKNIHNRYQNNEQLDTVDHLLSELNVESTFMFSCLSSIDHIDLSYFATYFDPDFMEKKMFIVFLLCDGYHFQQYIADMRKKQIAHTDSPTTTENSANATSNKISNIFLGTKTFKFKSLFSTRNNFNDFNSFGIWLVNGICTFVLNLPFLNDRCLMYVATFLIRELMSNY